MFFKKLTFGILSLVLLFTMCLSVNANAFVQDKEINISGSIENGWAYKLSSKEPLNGYVQVNVSSTQKTASGNVEVYYMKGAKPVHLTSVAVNSSGKMYWSVSTSEVSAGDKLVYMYNGSKMTVTVESAVINN